MSFFQKLVREVGGDGEVVLWMTFPFVTLITVCPIAASRLAGPLASVRGADQPRMCVS